jgi:hypothetical protein
VALIVCKVCKKAFISGSPDEQTCPACAAKVKEVYSLVHNFLRDNEKKVYTVHEVSRILGIEADSVKSLVALGMIKFGSSQTGGLIDSAENPAIERLTSGKSTMFTPERKQRR